MKFSCQQCGACCRIPNGIVRVSEEEIRRISEFLTMSESEFIANETEIAPDRKGLILRNDLNSACVWLTKDNRCRIHSVKPERCRTFPFEWTNKDSHLICPGLREGRGKTD